MWVTRLALLWGLALLLLACGDAEGDGTRDASVADDASDDASRMDGGASDAGGDASDTGAPDTGPTPEGPWLVYRPGLAVGVFALPETSIVGDSEVHIVRIDPAYFEFRLVARGELGEPSHTVPEWVAAQGLTGAINASMYQEDHRTSVFYMRAGEYTNNGTWSDAAGAVFATDTDESTLPGARLIDRNCEDLEALDANYATLVQNFRMLTCDGEPAWSDRDQIYSIASVGRDDAGRILFIHSRSPYSVHDLTVMLLSLPIGIVRLMYVEGGPEASLRVELDGEPIVSRIGSYETGFWEADDNVEFWPVPNVIGFFPREAP